MTHLESKVVHAFPTSELPENLMQIEPRNPALPYHCAHEAIRLDQHDRAVFCARCGATLDPFMFLVNNAVTIQRAWQNHAEAMRKVRDLNDRIEVLAKEEKRLSAMVKRRQEKVGVVDVRGKQTL
jgi:hypothetical protein